VPCGALAEHAGKTVELRGWLAASRRVQTSRGEWMRFLSLEDESGMAEVVLFPRAYARLGPELAGRGPFTLVGVVIDNMGACALRPD
jgi:DNA polymerase III alpha subunit